MADFALRFGLTSLSRAALLAVALAAATVTAVAPAVGSTISPPLRVCAYPNNMPFSRADGAGFENKLAALIGARMGRKVEFYWRAQRRGFLRQSLNAGKCDLVAGFPTRADALLTTRPYYRSTYVFVTRADERAVSSYDDPTLKTLRIGVQLIGDDGMNTPPAHELARRGIVENVRGYPVYGNYAKPAPPSAIVDAVARGDIDVAAVWGPLAGYFAARATPPLVVTPVDASVTKMPMAFDISLGVRKDDGSLAAALQTTLDDEKLEIDRLLAEYQVPMVPAALTAAQQ